MKLLEVKGLTKRFGGLTAIDSIDLTIDEGQIVSVIGPNGAGKTTFFNMISGLYPSDEGEIIFNGKKLNKLTPEKVASCRISRTFQNIRLFPEMLTVENIMVGMNINLSYGIKDIIFKTKKMKDAELSAYMEALKLLEYVGLEEKEKELAKSLPYGDQRRLEIARALALRPKLIMLDEPAAGLNPKETEEMKEFILKIRKDFGCSILLIEHDMKLVMGISDKIAVINYGVKIAEGKPDYIKTHKEVIKAYLGEESEEITA
ncbi:ABC transporter ATP-binding protein [Clostridium polyendosporum]|uniref:ABC transporter ATP-binding protein n=1 Tax=Clostridium polyendosporum TaxID=69208 RepID=A0A919RYC3_9CLOT|nr:ABC transporter ATP-binding protein [Clostridium polyendosporum]GIM28009.1 ABC transporter ATP-binding protein [Clostridium polyendosporum]